jgi:hypothetical protein
MFDDDLGLWLTLAQANVEEDLMLAGVPILRGPYTVDYTDIPHDGDTMTLWTPAVGDVLLRLFCDWQTVIQWDQGRLAIGQNVAVSEETFNNVLSSAVAGSIAGAASPALDLIVDAVAGIITDGDGNTLKTTARVFHTTDPVQIQLAQTGGTDPAAGHVELYALVARAVAP